LGRLPSPLTVAIPTHNRRETLLLAVRSALAQTRAPEQVIVLCDGCTDGSADAVRALGDERAVAIDLPKLPGYGYEHRNRALELARGDAILWLGDDDLLLADHLERVGEVWDRGGVQLVQSPAVLVAEDDALEWLGLDWSVPGHRATLERHNTNVLASVLVGVRAARVAGGWDPDQPRLGDWDLWKRVLAGGARTAMTDEPTVLHFRASGRQQAWPDRVRQNSAWWRRIGDPGELASLRAQLRRLRAVREAEWAQEREQAGLRLRDAYAELERVAASGQALADELARRDAEVIAQDRELQRVRAELERLAPELERLETERPALEAELSAARARGEHAHELERVLARTYAGGWWRLRARLLPLMRVFGRGGG